MSFGSSFSDVVSSTIDAITGSDSGDSGGGGEGSTSTLINLGRAALEIGSAIEQDRSLRREARLERARAQQVRDRGEEERGVASRNAARLRASQRASFGAAGVQATGTPTFVLLRTIEDQQDFAERNFAAQEDTAQIFDTRARNLRRAARTTRTFGLLGAGLNFAARQQAGAERQAQLGGQ